MGFEYPVCIYESGSIFGHPDRGYLVTSGADRGPGCCPDDTHLPWILM